MSWKGALHPWLTVILIPLLETMSHRRIRVTNSRNKTKRPENALDIYAYLMIAWSLYAALVRLAKGRIMTKCRSASNWQWLQRGRKTYKDRFRGQLVCRVENEDQRLQTNVMHFRNSGNRRTSYQFRLGTQSVEVVEKYKYLGVFLDEFLKCHTAANILRESAGRALGVSQAGLKL